MVARIGMEMDSPTTSGLRVDILGDCKPFTLALDPHECLSMVASHEVICINETNCRVNYFIFSHQEQSLHGYGVGKTLESSTLLRAPNSSFLGAICFSALHRYSSARQT